MKENKAADKGSRSASSWRKKIPMKKIQKKTSLQVTFSKRRPGLFKKAKELSLLCGADVAVIAFSPGGKLFMFGNPSAEVIIDRYINSVDPVGQAPCRETTVERPEVVKEEDRYINSVDPVGQAPCRETTVELPEVVKEGPTGGNRQGFWWEAPESELERMDLTELERYGGELEKFMDKLRSRLNLKSS